VTAESPRPAAKPPRYRHPATVLLLGVFTASELFLNAWYVPPPPDSEPSVFWKRPDGPVHGYPVTWLERDYRFFYLLDAVSEGERLHLKQELQLALPLELLVGDTTGVSFRLWALAIDLAIGLVLFLLLRRLGDRFFGFREVPFYRFGLRTALACVTAVAVLFAAANVKFLHTASLITFFAAIALALLYAVVLEFDAELAGARDPTGRYRAQQRDQEKRTLEEVERTEASRLDS
jgi:hypothetical protein